MLPQKVILSIFAALITQGNIVHALPLEEPLYTRSERIHGNAAVKSILDTREPTVLEGDVLEFPGSESSVLEARVDVPSGVSVLASVTLCVLSHKVISGVVIYFYCPKPKENLATATKDLGKSLLKVFKFDKKKNMDAEARIAEIVSQAPPEKKTSIAKGLKEVGKQLVIASMIIMDTAASAHLRKTGELQGADGNEKEAKKDDPASANKDDPLPAKKEDPVPAKNGEPSNSGPKIVQPPAIPERNPARLTNAGQKDASGKGKGKLV